MSNKIDTKLSTQAFVVSVVLSTAPKLMDLEYCKRQVSLRQVGLIDTLVAHSTWERCKVIYINYRLLLI